MTTDRIKSIAESEMARMFPEPEQTTKISVFRRPDPRDETDRLGAEIVRRMIEAGVVEPK